ncbi:ubiquinol-cytochrome c reductase cytochrome c subunit [Murinocardiopsis flavida]|uniref:Cytochrome bc1 complex cytochrome c subunit n=1 Tax=Murinocardiopsis flavida TaxID=645275 RepID=A0A2P8D059_9ACTN|nr:cytochrome c [Murinocardiopsis flavida]PSK90556.1 ubiquinol-cytochrome c reductase cytochrome c subunit [Murinocardiopsis flavida]
MKWITARRRHPLAGYVVVILALVVFGVGYTFLAPTADRAEAQQDQAAPERSDGKIDLAQGKEIFAQSCASCHGKNAEGKRVGDTDVPSLIGVGGAAVDFQVSTGRMPSMNADKQMPRKYPAFTQDEIDDLVAFYEDEFGDDGPKVPEEDLVPATAPERNQFPSDHEGEKAFEKAKEEYDEAFASYTSNSDTEAGMKLYLTNCAHCHSWSGAGGALTDGRWAPELHEASPRQLYEAMLTGPGAMPVFNDATVSAEDKQNIIAYVNDLQEEPDAGGPFALGRVGQVAEGFIGWTIGISLIVACAIWITAKQRSHD